MNKLHSIRTLYGLDYDTSGFNSSLILWYNKFIDKSLSEINVGDVSRMLRQDILPDIAIDKAIEFFLKNPFEGEFYEGGLLKQIVRDGKNITKSKHIKELQFFLEKSAVEDLSYDWEFESEKLEFEENLIKLKEILKT